jgi:predicted amidohydrolase
MDRSVSPEATGTSREMMADGASVLTRPSASTASDEFTVVNVSVCCARATKGMSKVSSAAQVGSTGNRIFTMISLGFHAQQRRLKHN